MADLKFSQMPAAASLAGTEIIPIVQDNQNLHTTPNAIRAGLVESDVTGITGASAVNNIVTISQANYDAIAVKDPNTVYVIV